MVPDTEIVLSKEEYLELLDARTRLNIIAEWIKHDFYSCEVRDIQKVIGLYKEEE